MFERSDHERKWKTVSELVSHGAQLEVRYSRQTLNDEECDVSIWCHSTANTLLVILGQTGTGLVEIRVR